MPSSTDEQRHDEPAMSVAGLGCSQVEDERIALMGLLVEATDRLTRVLGLELERACGLPLSFFDVLLRLTHAPEHRLTMTELAAQTRLTSGGATRLVDRVAEAGYVERQGCPTDRRSVYVAITPAGEVALAGAAAIHLESLDQHLLAPLSAGDRAALRRALSRLVASEA
jgi:DNA-binding MarR family transcriptional regulator